jgi:asparagine synthase (glutamine-hydrolysing)
LSGGIDSSSIAALASRFHYRRLTTLSVVFEEPDYSEAAYARLAAKQYGTDHREVLLRRKDFFEELPRILDAMDQPTVDGVNTYFVSKAAREAELTVVLSGAGGDEVFLGYDHFKKAASLGRARRFLGVLPLRARRTLLRAAFRAGFPSNAPGRERLAYLEAPSDENTYLLFRGLFAPRQIRDLLGISERELAYTTQSPNLHPISTQSLNLSLSQSPSISTNLSISNSLLNSFTLFEFNHYLQNQLLKDIDAMSMAHSIETRVPFLDHRLVEYVAGLPDKVKLRNGMNKPLLVKAMGEILPKEVWKRPKMGFTFPFGEWMKKGADELEARSLEQKSFERKEVEKVWDGFKKGRVHWSRPWSIIVASYFT